MIDLKFVFCDQRSVQHQNTTLMDIINDDNIFAVGTKIVAKQDPTTQLVIQQYRQRIYYCQLVQHPEDKLLAYYERELIAPRAN